MRRVRKASGWCVAVLLVVWAGSVRAADRKPPQQRGVCFVGGPRPVKAETFERLAALGVNWISETPFGWQRQSDNPEVVMATSGRVWWGESDEGLVETARMARAYGIRTMLKPHIWIRGRNGGQWQGEINFPTEPAWQHWWASYRQMILHYARLAQASRMDALCVGTELRSTVLKDPAAWRKLIADVRKVYGGKVTYAANWYREFEEVPFWEALDYISIQAYFPLADRADTSVTVASLKAAWAPYVGQIEALQKRVGKPVLFTEVGYRSTADAAAKPWVWHSDAPPDPSLQAMCYEAMFETFWNRPWFAGAYIWKWFPEYNPDDSARTDPWASRMRRRREAGFTPQGKPAEAVLKRWFSGEGGKK